MSSNNHEPREVSYADADRYALCYLTRDERELLDLKPCHLCCFQGRCTFEPSCKHLGLDAYFLQICHDHQRTHAQSANAHRISAARAAWNRELQRGKTRPPRNKPSKNQEQ